MARPKTQPGEPCRKGHPYERNADNQCVACRREWYAKNISRLRAQWSAWRAANREHVRSYHRAWERRSGNSQRRRLGIDAEAFRRLFAGQGSRCGICGTTAAAKWVLDHDHETDVARGVLCHPCNLGLGHFRDDVGRLRAAAVYLDAHRLF